MQEIKNKLTRSGFLSNKDGITQLKLIHCKYNITIEDGGKIILTEFDYKTLEKKDILYSSFDNNTEKLKFLSIHKNPKKLYEIFVNRSNELVVNFYIDDKLKTTLTEQAGRTTIKNHSRREKDVIFPSINKIEGFTRYTYRDDGSVLQTKNFKAPNLNETSSTQMYAPDGKLIGIFENGAKKLTFFDPSKNHECFTIIAAPHTKNGYQLYCDAPIDSKEYNDYREKGKKIIKEAISRIMGETRNFSDPNSRLPDFIADAYLSLNAEQPDKVYSFFFQYGYALANKQSLQNRLFKDGETVEFKVTGIPNIRGNHALCAIVPNPYIHPNKKIFILDSANNPKKYMDGQYMEVPPELRKDVIVLNTPGILQKGNLCTLFAASSAEVCMDKTLDEIYRLSKIQTTPIIIDGTTNSRQISKLEMEIIDHMRSKFGIHTDKNVTAFQESSLERASAPHFEEFKGIQPSSPRFTLRLDCEPSIINEEMIQPIKSQETEKSIYRTFNPNNYLKAYQKEQTQEQHHLF